MKPDTKAAAAPLDVQLSEAIACFHRGEVAAARLGFERILAQAPGHFDAHHLLGVALHHQGDPAGAIEHFETAIALFPGNAHFHSNLGGALQALGRFEPALAAFDRAIALMPAQAAFHYNRGVVLQQQGRWADAVDSFDAAIARDGKLVDAHNNRANVLLKQGRAAEAIDGFALAIGHAPQRAALYLNRANALATAGRAGAAIEDIGRALALEPALTEAYVTRASLLLDQGKAAQAADDCLLALQQKPQFALAYSNLAAAMRELGRLPEALECANQAVAIDPGLLEAYINRAAILNMLERLPEAVADHARIIELAPQRAESYFRLGNTLYKMGQIALAQQSYEQALLHDPGNPSYQMHLSFPLLLQGDYARGLPLYEARHDPRVELRPGTRFDFPRWTGDQPLAGRTLLVVAEQGLGDTLQGCRYMAALSARGAEIILVVQAELVPLMQMLDGVARVMQFGQVLPDADYYCYLLGLPLLFGTRLDTIPVPIPYLACPPAKRLQWQARLAQSGARRIGLVWSGNPQHQNDANRSMPLATFVNGLPAGPAYVVLQPVIRERDLAALQARPDLLLLQGEIKDFGDTAALCEQLDLVITVDTSVAHLAGAMGKPTWLLLPFVPDWRWLMDGESNAWYPTMRLLRQSRAGDWDAVMAQLARDLAGFGLLPGSQ